MRLAIINPVIITDQSEIHDHSLIIKDGKIEELSQKEIDTSAFDRVIDAHGAYLSPGWIDIHTHGIGGYDFMDTDSEGAREAMHEYARHGVTGVFPTTMSAPYEDIISALESLAETKFDGGARFLGAHIEGPYFSPEQCGAQPPEQLKTPDDGFYAELISKYPFIARIDAAPELPGSLQMAKELTAHGVIAGIAHTNANSAETLTAIEAGYTIATHLFSGMSGVHRKNGYRYGGTVEACLLSDDVYCETICDGIHLPPELLALTHKVKGAHRMILVSDSMRGAAMPVGSECMLGNKNTGTRTVVDSDVAWLPDRSAFAGSIATYDRLIRTALNVAHIPMTDVVTMATKTPASAMRLKNKGRIAPGYDADITIFDKNINVLYTIVNGTLEYNSEDKQK